MRWRFGKYLAIGILALLTLTACSNNKQNINEQMFEEGQKLVQQYYQATITGDDSFSWDTANAFLSKYENKATSDAEKLFIDKIGAMALNFQLYGMKKASEEFSGQDQGSDWQKQKVLEIIKELHEKFGISYE